MSKKQFRTERDSLGEFEVPVEALYGVHTARALINFPITGVRIEHFPELVVAIAMVKKAAAMANHDLGILDGERANAIIHGCDAIIAGDHHEQFAADMIQGGAGTSTNMNANEVIANLALIEMGRNIGEYGYLHPNDHVNLSQSTNDVYPTAARLAILRKHIALIEEQKALSVAFIERADVFKDILKVGRTQLQDAVPMTLGSEFAGFAETIKEDIDRLSEISALLKFSNLGGTAVGTGINAPAGYAELVTQHLSEISGVNFNCAANLIEASSDMGAFVTFAGILKRIAVKLSKICNDLRLLSSGPRSGIGEISLPPVQAGSSIMPGKVNPVIPEVVNQVAYQVIGNELTIVMAAESGQLQLNAMEPIIVYNLLESIRIMVSAMRVLNERCVSKIQANEERCKDLLHNSLVLATALVPVLGYDKAASVAKQALATDQSVTSVVLQSGLMSKAELDLALNVEKLLTPQEPVLA